MNKQSTIKKILELNTIAVVGFSPKPERPSHYVSIYLKETADNKKDVATRNMALFSNTPRYLEKTNIG